MNKHIPFPGMNHRDAMTYDLNICGYMNRIIHDKYTKFSPYGLRPITNIEVALIHETDRIMNWIQRLT